MYSHETVLRKVIRRGNIDLCAFLIEQEKLGSFCETLFKEAFESRNERLILYLSQRLKEKLEHKIVKVKYLPSLLNKAARQGYLAVFSKLISEGGLIPTLETLLNAIKGKQSAIIQSLIKENQIALSHADRLSILNTFSATQGASTHRILPYLLKYFKDSIPTDSLSANEARSFAMEFNKHLLTILERAAAQGDLESVKLIITTDKITVRGSILVNALGMANNEVVTYLLKQDCNLLPNLESAKGKTIFLLACEFGYLSLVKQLIHKVTIQESSLDAAMQAACKGSSLEMIQCLLEAYVPYQDLVPKRVDTWMKYAIRFGRVDIIRYLLSSINSEWTVIKCINKAAEEGQLAIVVDLVDRSLLELPHNPSTNRLDKPSGGFQKGLHGNEIDAKQLEEIFKKAVLSERKDSHLAICHYLLDKKKNPLVPTEELLQQVADFIIKCSEENWIDLVLKLLDRYLGSTIQLKESCVDLDLIHERLDNFIAHSFSMNLTPHPFLERTLFSQLNKIVLSHASLLTKLFLQGEKNYSYLNIILKKHAPSIIQMGLNMMRPRLGNRGLPCHEQPFDIELLHQLLKQYHLESPANLRTLLWIAAAVDRLDLKISLIEQRGMLEEDKPFVTKSNHWFGYSGNLSISGQKWNEEATWKSPTPN
jgi:ankyrin repeat protein